MPESSVDVTAITGFVFVPIRRAGVGDIIILDPHPVGARKRLPAEVAGNLRQIGQLDLKLQIGGFKVNSRNGADAARRQLLFFARRLPAIITAEDAAELLG